MSDVFSPHLQGDRLYIRLGMDDRQQMERCERRWIEEPVFYISTCTKDRRAVLNTETAVNLLVEEWALARKQHGWSVGRYLVMPERVQFFCAADISARPLSQWLQIWKEWTSKRMVRELGFQSPIWEIEISKSLLHSSEAYSQKLRSVLDDPVQANLVADSEDWPWRGEIEHF